MERRGGRGWSGVVSGCRGVGGGVGDVGGGRIVWAAAVVVRCGARGDDDARLLLAAKE